MNQTANQFGLNFNVYQRNFRWFVTTPSGETLPFCNGITFPLHDPAVINPSELTQTIVNAQENFS